MGRPIVLGGNRPTGGDLTTMLYAILAYHDETVVQSWTPDEDADLMEALHRVHDPLVRQGRLGPAARLGATGEALTLRGPGPSLVTDGPFAETKEALLGFYVVRCDGREGALAIARDLHRANPTAVYEVRPIALMLEGANLDDAAIRRVPA
jgi:hypothetical protein